MLNQQNKQIAKHSTMIRFSFRLFLPAMIFCWYFVFGYISVSAQNLTPEIRACYQSAQARYACYIKRREGELERAKEMETYRRSVLDAKKDLREEMISSPKKQREKNRQEIMKQIEASRSRNISHKGEKYSITYGYVIEVRP